MEPASIMALISALGTLGGGAMSLFGKKQPAQTTQMPNFDQGQQNMMAQLGQMGMQGMQNPTQGFEPIAQQARDRFKTDTIPSLAERFTSFGQGGQRGSDFQGAVAGAGADLEGQLAAQGSQYGLQQQGLLQQLLGMSLQPKFSNMHQPEQPGAMQQFGGNLFNTSMQGLAQVPKMFEAQNHAKIAGERWDKDYELRKQAAASKNQRRF